MAFYDYFSISFVIVFFLITLPPPRSTLFPYTTLFRSVRGTASTVFAFRKRRSNSPKSRRTSDRSSSGAAPLPRVAVSRDRKSTRLNSSHLGSSYAVFCLKKKKSIHGSQQLPQF